jgi:hypothetical protein
MRRVHKYPMASSAAASISGGGATGAAGSAAASLDEAVLGVLRARAKLQHAALDEPALAEAAAAAGASGRPLFDGSRHLDELCVALRTAQTALEDALDAHGGFCYVLR